MYAQERCLLCGDCSRACTHGALRWDGAPVRDEQRCELCGDCCDVCATEARRLVGYRVSVDQLLKTILRDRILYEESGGGVTFSGGEPLVQAEFLESMLAACREEGIHTVVDTCGYASSERFDRICSEASMLLFDLKVMDPERHRDVTGVSNEIIIENLKSAVRNRKPLVVRIPVVPNVNDDPKSMDEMRTFLKRVGVRRVDLLAYHQSGQEKYRRMGMECKYEANPPTSEQMELLREQFSKEGFAVRIGG